MGDEPVIERSWMDGSMRKVVVKDLVFPQGLIIDAEDRKLFWADAARNNIEMSDLDGKHRKTLIPLDTHPFGLAQVMLFSQPSSVAT